MGDFALEDLSALPDDDDMSNVFGLDQHIPFDENDDFGSLNLPSPSFIMSCMNDDIDGNDSELKRFNWKGKQFFRIRIDNLRVYFERVPPSLHCHFILPKHSLNDFLVRCKLPSSELAVLENHKTFWEYLESLTKR